MNKVICDANIWYDLAEKRIDPETIAGISLMATSVNIHELSVTPNLVGNPALVQRTIKALLQYNSGIYILNPFEYLIYNFHQVIYQMIRKLSG